jgi:branched-chain amino acid transport system substrate-binding protein
MNIRTAGSRFDPRFSLNRFAVRIKNIVTVVMAVAVAVTTGLISSRSAAADDIVIGVMCDRTGPTQGNGVIMCGAAQDYFDLVNSKGGVEGYKFRPVEVDAEYKVPLGIEAYERWKREGAVSIMLYGTNHVQSLQQRMAEDKLPGTSPGFGTATSSDGARYPYLFPIAATFYSQAAAGVKFAGEKIGGLKGKKIAFLFFDNPTGREPTAMLEALAKSEGFELKTFSVPPPGIEMSAQVLDITQRFKPDFLITNLFGRAASVGVKALGRAGYSLDKAVALAWGATDADLEGAGGMSVGEGYYAMMFHGVGSAYSILQDVRDMYESEGKALPKAFGTVLYNRWLFHAAIQVEAARLAAQSRRGAKITSEDMRRGFESISGASLAKIGGMAPPLRITAADHEGGGWIQIYQIRGGQYVKATEYFTAYADVKAQVIRQQK